MNAKPFTSPPAESPFTVRFNLRDLLDPEDLRALTERAAAERTTPARLVRRMLADDLRREEPGSGCSGREGRTA